MALSPVGCIPSGNYLENNSIRHVGAAKPRSSYQWAPASNRP
jgi:hypothetical protein